MANFTNEEKAALKGRGMIISRDGEHFVARILTENGTLNSEQLRALADAADKYAQGTIGLTTRLSVEMPGVPYENIEPLVDYLHENGMDIGGTGPKIRPVVSCKGTVCVHGLIDTQGFAKELHDKYYVGWHDVTLPAKFKIAVGGCPNNCVKPSLNDFGISGWTRTDENGNKVPGYKITIGGIWGRTQRIGTPIEGVFSKEQVYDILEQVLHIWMEEAEPKERFGRYLDRIGVENFIAKLKF